MLRRFLTLLVCLIALALNASAQEGTPPSTPAASSTEQTAATQPPAAAAKPSTAPVEYRLLATNRVSTMDKEMKEEAAAGFRFDEVVSGNTYWGGAEALVIMSRPRGGEHKQRYEYKLLATSKTSTMQKEILEASEAGFQFVGVSVGETFFGGSEVVTIMRRPRNQ